MKLLHQILKKNAYILLLLGILVLGIFLRVYKFPSIPPGLYQDETALGYNAYSILKTGKDEHGMKLPVYFKSFNDNKLPLYIYSTAFFIKILGTNELAVRITSLLSGLLAILALYGIANLLFNRKVALVSVFLLAINPWHISFSRAAFEVNLGVTLLLISIWFFLLGLKRKRWFWFLCAIFFNALSMYSYNVTRVFAPLLLLLLAAFFWKEIRTIVNKKSFIIILLVIAFLITPIALATISGNSGIDKQATVFIFGKPATASYLELRSYMLTLPTLIAKGFFNTGILTFWHYIQNSISYLSTEFFFINADKDGLYGIGNHGMFYVFEFITVIAGFIILLKNRSKKSNVVLVWFGAGLLLTSVSVIVPHGTRSYILLPSLCMISAVGLVYLWDRINKIDSIVKYVLKGLIVCIIVISVSYFCFTYFYKNPIFYSAKWRSQDKPLAEYLLANSSEYKRIIFDKRVNYVYTSLLFYQAVDPNYQQRESKYAPDGNLIYLSKLGRYEIKNIDWAKDLQEETLIISKTQNAPSGITPLLVLYYPERPVVLEFNGQIAQYPTRDEAYAIYTKQTNN